MVMETVTLLLLLCATSMSLESFPCVQHHLVWLGHENGQRRGQLNRGSEVVVLLLL